MMRSASCSADGVDLVLAARGHLVEDGAKATNPPCRATSIIENSSNAAGIVILKGRQVRINSFR